MILLEQMNYYRDEELAYILCYPRYDPQEFMKRINYLDAKGIRLLKAGKTLINNHNVLGKGHAGIVIKGMLDDKIVAVKVRRMDSKRRDLNHEADMLRLANGVGVGPELFSANKDMIVMEYIDGVSIGKLDYNKDVISDILEQCFKLDLINLDHGELSRMNKHIIVGSKVKIIDFDSASINRRASNVTSATQYLLNDLNNSIFALLREYKRCICRRCFDKLLVSLKVK